MSLDVVCAETTFLDLTFAGLEALPGPGEERYAEDLLRSPGGGAITAIGCARLGLETALASPIGADPDGDFLRAALEAEGVRCTGRRVARTAVTAVLPVAGDRAMVTYDPFEAVDAADLAAGDPRAVIVSVRDLANAPAGARAYAALGDAVARDGLADAAALRAAAAIVLNDREAGMLTGAGDPVAAASALAAETGSCVVVTCGADGAVAVEGGTATSAEGVAMPAVDTTGAGDLFAAAYVWADLRGLPLATRLRWAALYAALSVRVPTGAAGAATLDELVHEGESRGLAPPARVPSTSRGGGTP